MEFNPEDTIPFRARAGARQPLANASNEDVPEIVIQEIPLSPGEAAFGPRSGGYFSPSIKATSGPLPVTADIFMGLRPDGSLSGQGSPIGTPLTSISSTSFFVDSSASVPHTTLTSVYTGSPPVNPSNRPTSLPVESGHAVHLNLGLDALLPAPRPPDSSFHPIQNISPTSEHNRAGDFSPVSESIAPPELQYRQFSQSLGGTTPDSSQQSPFVQQYPTQFTPQSRLEQLHSPNISAKHAPKPNDQPKRAGNFPQFQTSLFQPWNQLNSPEPRPRAYQALRPPPISSNAFGAPTAVPFGLHGNPTFLGSPLARDALLAYAHRLYNDPARAAPLGLTTTPHQSDPDADLPSQSHHRSLLPLLESIRIQHPEHLPTLLLISCVQYSIGDYDACQATCGTILSIDPNYVEAMSNLGMVMREKGVIREAETWWLKAIRLRPTYWDAIDNLLHVLCDPRNSTTRNLIPPRYEDALHILDYVLNILIRPDGLLLILIQPAQLYRLQNLLFTRGNLRSIVQKSPRSGVNDYLRALELVFRHPGSLESGDPIRLRDVILATVVIGLLASTPPNSSILNVMADALSVDPARFTTHILERGINWLSLVHRAGQTLVDVLLREGHGALPIVFLAPEKASRIPEVLFSVYARSLPALCVRASYEDQWQIAQGVDSSALNKVTSNICLTIAKLLLHAQERRSFTPIFDPGAHIPLTPSLVIILYYLALSLNPTPSTYNNMGILFFSTKHSATTTNAQGQHETVTGLMLAQMYYKKGLAMDPDHPHLLTNYASLLKDQGRSLEAIRMYEQALKVKPDFDVALVNIANVVKDTGRLTEAVTYYRRALAASPDSPDAICGFVNALSSVCDWRWGRGSMGNEPIIDEQGEYSLRPNKADISPHGWMGKMEIAIKKQLKDAYLAAVGVIKSLCSIDQWQDDIQAAYGAPPNSEQRQRWTRILSHFYTDFDRQGKVINETGFLIRLVEMLNRIIQQRWYYDLYVDNIGVSKPPGSDSLSTYRRLRVPPSLEPPPVPSVLPFHTFTYPLDARILRLVAHRNAIRISFHALTAPWLPKTVYRPPSPPRDKINIGYVSSDFNNHPLAHLMLSAFALHDRQKFNIYVYATSSSDNSHYRQRIEQDAQIFRDVSTSPAQAIVEQIVEDQIHVLVNLGGYTKGARNDIFAARPCPVQIALMGYAGTLSAGWADYLVGDARACPKEAFEPYRSAMRRKAGHQISRLSDHFGSSHGEEDLFDDESDPESLSKEWSFTERFIHMPHSYFATDYRQAFRENHFVPGSHQATTWLLEERLRSQLRKEVFPDLDDDAVIFGCFSQLYKICPSVFFTWLRVLQRVPRSILWLLRFPSEGEENLLRVAALWAGEEVASRVRFTDVAPKAVHIRRCRVADLFLDTFQCNAHTIAADVLWTGTPILTWPKEHLKMCTRVASSIVYATGFGDQMLAKDETDYENRAVALAQSVSYRYEHNSEGGMDRRGSGELIELRKNIFLHRERMPLFDTRRWVQNLEKGFEEAWQRWVNSCHPPWTDDEDGGCITITDNEPFFSA